MTTYPPVTIIRVTGWGQRVIPSPGTKIGLRNSEWTLWLPKSENAHGPYDRVGVYIGFNLVVLD